MKIFMNNQVWELDCVYYNENIKKVVYEFNSTKFENYEKFVFMVNTNESLEDVLKISNAYIIRNKESD